MANKSKYDDAFKQNAIDLVLRGHKASQVARDLGLNPETLYQWLRKHRDSASHSPIHPERPLTSQHSSPSATDRAELERLRKEVELLRMERDILKKAVGIFSQQLK
jgi:transposase